MPSGLRTILFFLTVFLAACSSGEIGPVPIESGDMCSFCRMAISEKKFAAEMIMDDESVLKFDDIGCMLRYRKAPANKSNAVATFVMDHASQQWINVENAYFIQSPTLKTPMGGGIAAFEDRANAERLTANYETRILRFGELHDDGTHAK